MKADTAMVVMLQYSHYPGPPYSPGTCPSASPRCPWSPHYPLSPPAPPVVVVHRLVQQARPVLVLGERQLGPAQQSLHFPQAAGGHGAVQGLDLLLGRGAWGQGQAELDQAVDVSPPYTPGQS